MLSQLYDRVIELNFKLVLQKQEIKIHENVSSPCTTQKLISFNLIRVVSTDLFLLWTLKCFLARHQRHSILSASHLVTQVNANIILCLCSMYKEWQRKDDALVSTYVNKQRALNVARRHCRSTSSSSLLLCTAEVRRRAKRVNQTCRGLFSGACNLLK